MYHLPVSSHDHRLIKDALIDARNDLEKEVKYWANAARRDPEWVFAQKMEYEVRHEFYEYDQLLCSLFGTYSMLNRFVRDYPGRFLKLV